MIQYTTIDQLPYRIEGEDDDIRAAFEMAAAGQRVPEWVDEVNESDLNVKIEALL